MTELRIATVLSAHDNADTVKDTIDSIRFWSSDKILMVVDGLSWDWAMSMKLPVWKMKGYDHGKPRSPFKNVALGLSKAWSMWKGEIDWLCYCEYDVLFGSDRFKDNLRMADERDVWMLGNDGRIDGYDLSYLEALVGSKFKSGYYMIGCCYFFSAKYLAKLEEIDFFNRFINAANTFPNGEIPRYEGWDISEHAYPTLCRHMGGNIGVFATWDSEKDRWHGASDHFPVRFQPALEGECREASVMHPLKDNDHPARVYHRAKREALRKGNKQ